MHSALCSYVDGRNWLRSRLPGIQSKSQMLRRIRLDSGPGQEAAMSWFRFQSIRRSCAGVATLALTCALTLEPLAQTPKALLAIGSYAQQPPVKVDETPHFNISPELQGDVMMAHQRYIAALDAYRQGSMDSAVIWNKMGIANHHMFNLKEAQKDYSKALKLQPLAPIQSARLQRSRTSGN